MVFITVGTQKQNFKSLVDEINNSELLKKFDIVMQYGETNIEGINLKKIKFVKFLEQEQFERYIKDAEFIITHAGVGSIISMLKHRKKIIAIPRLKKYNEHIDDHQVDICKEFKNMNYLEYYNENDNSLKFDDLIKQLQLNNYKEYNTNNKIKIEKLKTTILKI